MADEARKRLSRPCYLRQVPARPHLFGLTPEALAAHLVACGVDASVPEARRYTGHVISRGGSGVSRRPPSKRFLEGVAAHVDHAPLEVLERVTDESDGFVKYLFRSPDGALSEAVRIPLEKPGRFTVCLSSQVGCAMRCVFCATGRLGLSRNLQAWEMVSAFCVVRDEALREELPGRVTGAVFMGQGEPLHNYDEVIAAAKVLSHPSGGRVKQESISISTVGLVPQVRRYAREGHRYRLIVSLTSAVADRRRRLLPVAGRFEMRELADAIREYAAVAKGRVTVAWVLLGGENHDAEEAQALAALLEGVSLRVNLIDVNGTESGGEFRRATDAERDAFVDELQVLRAPIVRRYSGGKSKHAACGMLAASRQG